MVCIKNEIFIESGDAAKSFLELGKSRAQGDARESLSKSKKAKSSWVLINKIERPTHKIPKVISKKFEVQKEKTSREKIWRAVKWIGGVTALGVIGGFVANYFFSKASEEMESALNEQWLQGTPETIKGEADFIGGMLSNLERLREMSEADLLFAVRDRPNTFDLLNFYRKNKEIPKDLQQVLSNYKLKELAEKNICNFPSLLGWLGTELNIIDHPIDLPTLKRRLETIKKRLDSLNPKGIDSQQLTEQWLKAKRDSFFVEFALSLPSEKCWNPEPILIDLEKALDSLQVSIAKTASSVRPMGVLRSLIDSTPHPVDDKLFQHILGDYWGGNSGLEGYQNLKMLRYVFEMMNQQIETLEKNPYCSDGNRAAICKWISGVDSTDLSVYHKVRKQVGDAIALTELYEKDPKEFQKGIQDSLRSSGSGENFFFMGGWTNKNEGHALVYEIGKQENGKVTFRIFNRGAGIEYHTKELTHEKLSSNTFIEITDIDESNFTSYPFLKAIMELERPPSDHKDWNRNDVYAILLPLLKGNVVAKNDSPETMMELLQVGHCTYLSLTGLMKRRMGESYGRFHFDLQFKTLSDYYEQIKNTLASDGFRRSLLKKGWKQLAHNVEASHGKNGLSLQELNFVNSRLKEIGDAIISGEEKQTPTLLAVGGSDLPIKNYIYRVDTFDFEKEKVQNKFYDLDAILFKHDPKTFFSDCKKWKKRFEKGNNEGHFLIVKQAIKDWVRNIPIAWIENPQIFLNAISPKQSEELLSQIAEIAKDFGFSQIKLTEQNPLRENYAEPTDLLTVIKLLTIGSAIGKSSKIDGGDLKGLYQWEMNLPLEGSSGHFLLFDPELEAQIGTIREYWNRVDPPEERLRRDHLSFFGAEALALNQGHTFQKIEEESDSCKNTFKWPDLAWAETYLQQPAIKDKIAKDNPILSRKTLTFQAMAALNDDIFISDDLEEFKDEIKLLRTKKEVRWILPKPFYALRDLSHLVDFMLRPAYKMQGISYGAFDRKQGLCNYCTLNFDSSCSRFYWFRQINPYGMHHPGSNIPDASHVNKAKNKYEGNFPEANRVDPNRILENGQDALGVYRFVFGRNRWVFPTDSEGKSIERLRVGSHLRIHFPFQQFSQTMNREEVDDLLSLSGARELQVIETLGYFKKRMFLFEQKDSRALFLALMAEPPLLVEQLKKGGEIFARQLADFVQEGYSLFEKVNNREASAYFLDVNRYLSAAVKQVLPTLDVGFLDSRKKLRQRLEVLEGEDPQEQTAVWLDLASELDPRTLDETGAIDLLSAYLFSYLHPLEETHPLYSISETTARIGHLVRFQTPLHQLLSSPAKDRILNGALHAVFPKNPSFQWKEAPAFPYFTTDKELFSIDVSTGKIYQQNQETVSLPKQISRLPILNYFIEDEKTLKVRQMSPNQYEWTAPDGMRIRVGETIQNLKIQREIEPNVWAQQIQPSPNFSIPPGLLIGNDLWVETKSNRQKFWVSGPSGKLLYRIEPSASDIYKVFRLNSDEPCELRIPPKDSVFNNLDQEGFVLFWMDRSSEQLIQVEVPRFAMTFSVVNGKILSSEVPGYFLAANQPHLLSQYYLPSVILENDQKKQKILFSNPFYSSHSDFKNPQKSAFVFNVDGSSLRPISSEDRLFLTLQQLRAGEYESAYHSLERYRSQLLPLTPQERTLLELVMNYGPEPDKIEKDDLSPSSVAIRLRALFLLVRNQLDFNGPLLEVQKYEKMDEIEDLLFRYVQYHDQTPPPLWLSLKEEEWLLRSLKIDKPLLMFRLLKDRLTTLKTGNPDFSTKRAAGDSFVAEWGSVEQILKSSFDPKQLDGNSIRSSNDSLLRREGLASSFKYFYGLARKGKDLRSYQIWAEDLFGRNLNSSLGVDELGPLIEEALSIIARSRAEPYERTAALILLAVYKNPESFNNRADHIVYQLDYYSRNADYSGDIKKYLLSPALEVLRSLKSLDLPNSQPNVPFQSGLPPIESTLDQATCATRNGATLKEEENLLSDLIEVVPRSTSPIAGFESLFKKTLADPILQQEFSNLSEQIKEFKPEDLKQMRLKSLEDLKEKKAWLDSHSVPLKHEIDRLRKQILQLANKESPDAKEQIFQKLRQFSGHKNPATLEDLLLLFLQFNPTIVKEANHALNCEESRELLDLMKQFLTLATRHQKQNRVLTHMDELEKLIESGASVEEVSLSVEGLQRISNATRTYSIDDHPEYLVFEYAMDLLLRETQVESLAKMANGTALESIMGSGKTMVLLVLMALQQADGKTLSMLVMPEALLPSVAETLKERLGNAFSRSAELFHFDRNTTLDKAALERILDRMKTAIKEKKAALISSSSLQSLILRFMERIQENKEEPSFFQKIYSLRFFDNIEEGKEEIHLFQEIFSLLRASGSLRLDEMDSLLDVLKAQHFTQGKSSKMSEDLLDAVTHVYNLLADRPRLRGALKWNYLSNAGTTPLTNESYESFAPVLIEELLTPSKLLDKEFNQFLNKLTDNQKDQLKDYLQQKPNTGAVGFVQAIPSQRIKNILAIWKEEASRLLLMTGKKQIAEHYGPDPKGSAMAIPYHNSNNPMVGSQHGTDLEILNYAMQMHLSQDLTLQTIQNEIESLKTQMIAELKVNNCQKFETTQAHREFLRLIGGRTDLSIFSLTSKNFEEIRRRVNDEAGLKVTLIRRHLLPKIETFSKQLHTNAHVFETLFQNTAGFSGTLWNAQSFPRSYQNTIKSDTEVRTLSLLWNAQSSVTVLQPKRDLQHQVEGLYRTHRGSFADLGALFRGIDSEKVAEAIIALPVWKDTRVKGIAFYDGENQKRVLLRGQKESVPFDRSGLNKDEIIAYWAQKYTTGSDIPLSADMRAIVTISQHTTMRDLLQAVWRLREIHRGQRVEFALLQEDAEIMAETLKNAGMAMEGAPSLADLFRFVKYNEAMRLGDDNLRALQFKLQNALIKPLWELILDPSQNRESLKIAVEELFTKTKPENAYDVYGAVQETAPVAEAVEDMLKKLKNSSGLSLLSESKQEEILTLWDEIVAKELPHLPLKTFRTTNYETKVEVQNQVNVQNEVKQEQKTVQQIQFDTNIPARHVFLWKEDGLFRRSYFASTRAPQEPRPYYFPDGALALPDFESFKLVPHPMDHLDVRGVDVLAQKGIRPLSAFGRYTEPTLKQSWNAIPNQKSQISLLIQDRTSKQIQVMVLSQWDALMFQRLLEIDRLNPQKGEREVDLALYHLDLGIVAQGSTPIDQNALQSSKEFSRLKIQMKFFNGQTGYDDTEIPILKDWIATAGAKNLKELFVNQILKDKPTSAGRYPFSLLEQLLSSEVK